MKLPKWLRRDTHPEAPAPKSPSPIELYEASGKDLTDAPPRTQEILRLAEESHRARRQDLRGRDEIGETRFAAAEPSGPLHAHEITPADAAVMRMMSGAKFGPNASVTLPSGRTVSGAEMGRWVE